MLKDLKRKIEYVTLSYRFSVLYSKNTQAPVEDLLATVIKFLEIKFLETCFRRQFE